jgi:hypothetical protein
VQVNLVAVEQFIRVVGEKEDAIFQRRMRMLQRDKQRRERDKVCPPLNLSAYASTDRRPCARQNCTSSAPFNFLSVAWLPILLTCILPQIL